MPGVGKTTPAVYWAPAMLSERRGWDLSSRERSHRQLQPRFSVPARIFARSGATRSARHAARQFAVEPGGTTITWVLTPPPLRMQR
ncbi:hypothetical protein Val02_66170 [Virgisporangium aliadipatigenens]|uniref:Uncharacterized protein n=1 Tax=Virgisporangium aliadipatigenens TaxID=741659 RepID=A0A8J3YTW2_9ACTN|nr:hypothetical protein Val02_66170 [Virgisporangium aliadipatigenens]